MNFNQLRELIGNSPLTEELFCGTGDGRLDSALSEEIVIKHIKQIL